MYREAKQRLGGDPVAAWAELTTDPVKRRRYQAARGKGGLVRIGWQEALEIAAAAHVHTLAEHGPDRIAGFSPIPAMSMASHAVGARFHALIGAPMLSFYDWYADLPIASPQVFGDQTDVPESGDWWDAAYLMLWGQRSRHPAPRRPLDGRGPPPRTEGRGRLAGYADATKFADEWLHPHPGTDGAMAMAMGHVILKECFVERQVPYFTDYVKRFTDLPFLVELEEREPGRHVPGRFVRAADLRHARDAPDEATRRWMPVLLDAVTGGPVVPNGTLGDRWSKFSEGRWNLDLGDIEPLLSLYEGEDGLSARVVLPRFDEQGATLERSVPVQRLGDRLVTTVFDLMLAQYGVGRGGLDGQWPASYEDAAVPCTPAWQEAITSVPAGAVVRAAREFARTAEQTRGRCMIVMGAGTNHWFHSDTIYRSFLSLLLLTGCQGVNGGGLGPLRGPGEGAAVRRLAAAGHRLRLGAALPADGGHTVLVPAHRPVALRGLRRRRAHLADGARHLRRRAHG
ncbi:molybdopterin-dependent oxidoreductase [Streptomyces sp. NPDC085929]|uniref:molybdopterin-dependent oxidoreductase n=1 Tax=Streptomyces sp. NPDC085929 TaxID=3365739 RepID=UPI0037D0493D